MIQKISQQNKNGFSLIEVLVAAGVASIVGLAIATQVANTARQNANIQQHLEVEMEQTFNRILSDPIICTCMFQGPPDKT